MRAGWFLSKSPTEIASLCHAVVIGACAGPALCPSLRRRSLPSATKWNTQHQADVKSASKSPTEIASLCHICSASRLTSSPNKSKSPTEIASLCHTSPMRRKVQPDSQSKSPTEIASLCHSDGQSRWRRCIPGPSLRRRSLPSATERHMYAEFDFEGSPSLRRRSLPSATDSATGLRSV